MTTGLRSGRGELRAVPGVADVRDVAPRQEQGLDGPGARLVLRPRIGLLGPALRGPRARVDLEAIAALRRNELHETLDALATHLAARLDREYARHGPGLHLIDEQAIDIDRLARGALRMP